MQYAAGETHEDQKDAKIGCLFQLPSRGKQLFCNSAESVYRFGGAVKGIWRSVNVNTDLNAVPLEPTICFLLVFMVVACIDGFEKLEHGTIGQLATLTGLCGNSHYE